MKKLVLIPVVLLLLGVCAFLALQLVPYGRDHSNPPVKREPTWDSPQTRALAKRACFDCHSNEVVWPWYSNLAPVSWLVSRDVVKGRAELNFSEWGGGEESEEIVEEIQKGKMPEPKYLIMHPEAKLTPAEKQQLIQGIQALGKRR